MEKITSLNQIPKGKLKNVIHLVEEDLLYKIAINFANIEIGKKLPGMTWDDLPDTNSLWDYIHVGNSWEEFKDGIKFAVRDRLSEAGEDENAKIAARKESNRIFAMEMELKKMRGRIKACQDGLIIEQAPLKGVSLSSHKDHRVAMALTIAALQAEGVTTIEDVEYVDKSYPTFFEDLKNLGAKIEIV